MRLNDTGVRLPDVVSQIVRQISRAEVEPLLPAMAADGLDVQPDDGTWLGLEEQGRILGVVRLFRRGEHDVVDDVWTHPSARRRGVAAALLAEATSRVSTLWLICDEPDIGYYMRRGFRQVDRQAFPGELAAHYAAKDEWPAAPDHEHYAMVRTASPGAR